MSNTTTEARSDAARKAAATRSRLKRERSERQRAAAHKAWATRRARLSAAPSPAAATDPLAAMVGNALADLVAEKVVARLRASGALVG